MDYSGQRFNQYQLIEKLGQGGMATVYKAFDTRLERDVAIKVVRKESIPPEHLDRILKRFEREAKALAKFIHPNIVPVHDYGEFEGAPYLVMAYLPGGTLKERIGKAVPVQQALNWVIPIASALSYAHQWGVIHRDVKLSNILITDDGTLMLSDFGIAQVLEETTTQLTATGMGVGTPEYMAPEQWQGKADAASDQYALGVVLFELLTGQKPYSAETPMAVALKVMSEPLPRPSALVPEIPESVEKVLYKALAKEPGDRYESMDTFRQALQGLLASAGNDVPDEEEAAIPAPPPTVPVDNKGETRDTLQPTSAAKDRKPNAKQEHKSRRKFPVWLPWGLLGVLVVILILVLSLGSEPDRTSTAEEVESSAGESLPSLTATVKHSPTYTATDKPILTATEKPIRTLTTTLTPTSNVSTQGSISINTHGVIWDIVRYEGGTYSCANCYRYNVFFSNQAGWDSDKYSLTIEFIGEYQGSHFCGFRDPKNINCQLRDYDGQTYVYCDTQFRIYPKFSETPCSYQMTLSNAINEPIYSYRYDYTFTKQY